MVDKFKGIPEGVGVGGSHLQHKNTVNDRGRKTANVSTVKRENQGVGWKRRDSGVTERGAQRAQVKMQVQSERETSSGTETNGYWKLAREVDKSYFTVERGSQQPPTTRDHQEPETYYFMLRKKPSEVLNVEMVRCDSFWGLTGGEGLDCVAGDPPHLMPSGAIWESSTCKRL